MAPKGWINTNLKPGKGRATRAGIRDTKEDIYRFPDPGSDSEFAPDPQPPSDAEEESDNAGPTTTQTGSFRDYPCVPCLKHMLKVPSNGHPEPCTDRTGGNYVACKFCGDKNLGCESPARYAKKHLIEWDKDDRREFIERFIKVAAKLQDAVTDNKKGLQSNWKKVVKEVQTEVNKVETAKAKQEAHEAKKKYEALREETDQIWARLKEVEDWIEKKTELFLSKDEDDNMFVRFMASAIILEKKDRKKFQETLDYIRGVGNDGTTDDDAAGEEEEEQQESSEEAREDEDVHMVSG